MTNENNLLLDEIYHTARMGQAAIAAVTPKVENPQLREKIESQGDDYENALPASRGGC